MEGFLEKIKEHGEYFEEILKRVYFIVIFFLIFFVIGFFSTVPLFRLSGVLIGKYLHIESVSIITTSPFQFVDLAVSTGIFIALIFTLPLVLFQIFSFLRNALTKKEKRQIIFYVPLALVLFSCGFAYGFAALYYAINVVAQINLSLGIQNLWDISRFLSQIILTAAFLGVLFQFPLILTLLIKASFIDAAFLRSKRRHAIIIILIITALLPPTDGVSLIVMTAPLLLLYEGTVLLNNRKILINN